MCSKDGWVVKVTYVLEKGGFLMAMGSTNFLELRRKARLLRIFPKFGIRGFTEPLGSKALAKFNVIYLRQEKEAKPGARRNSTQKCYRCALIYLVLEVSLPCRTRHSTQDGGRAVGSVSTGLM